MKLKTNKRHNKPDAEYLSSNKILNKNKKPNVFKRLGAFTLASMIFFSGLPTNIYEDFGSINSINFKNFNFKNKIIPKSVRAESREQTIIDTYGDGYVELEWTKSVGTNTAQASYYKLHRRGPGGGYMLPYKILVFHGEGEISQSKLDELIQQGHISKSVVQSYLLDSTELTFPNSLVHFFRNLPDLRISKFKFTNRGNTNALFIGTTITTIDNVVLDGSEGQNIFANTIFAHSTITSDVIDISLRNVDTLGAIFSDVTFQNTDLSGLDFSTARLISDLFQRASGTVQNTGVMDFSSAEEFNNSLRTTSVSGFTVTDWKLPSLTELDINDFPQGTDIGRLGLRDITSIQGVTEPIIPVNWVINSSNRDRLTRLLTQENPSNPDKYHNIFYINGNLYIPFSKTLSKNDKAFKDKVIEKYHEGIEKLTFDFKDRTYDVQEISMTINIHTKSGLIIPINLTKALNDYTPLSGHINPAIEIKSTGARPFQQNFIENHPELNNYSNFSVYLEWGKKLNSYDYCAHHIDYDHPFKRFNTYTAHATATVPNKLSDYYYLTFEEVDGEGVRGDSSDPTCGGAPNGSNWLHKPIKTQLVFNPFPKEVNVQTNGVEPKDLESSRIEVLNYGTTYTANDLTKVKHTSRFKYNLVKVTINGVNRPDLVDRTGTYLQKYEKDTEVNIEMTYEKGDVTVTQTTEGLDAIDQPENIIKVGKVCDIINLEQLMPKSHSSIPDKYRLVEVKVDGRTVPNTTRELATTSLRHIVTYVYAKNNSTITYNQTGLDSNDVDPQTGVTVQKVIGSEFTLSGKKPSSTVNANKYRLARIEIDGQNQDSLQDGGNFTPTKLNHIVTYVYERRQGVVRFQFNGLPSKYAKQPPQQITTNVDEVISIPDITNILPSTYELKSISTPSGISNEIFNTKRMKVEDLDTVLTYNVKGKPVQLNIEIEGIDSTDDIGQRQATVNGFVDEEINFSNTLQTEINKIANDFSNKYSNPTYHLDDNLNPTIGTEKKFTPTENKTYILKIKYTKKATTVNINTEGLESKDTPMAQNLNGKVGDTITLPELKSTSSFNDKYSFVEVRVDGVKSVPLTEAVKQNTAQKTLLTTKPNHTVTYVYSINQGRVGYEIEGLEPEDTPSLPSEVRGNIEATIMLQLIQHTNLNALKYILKEIQVDGVIVPELMNNRNFKISKLNHNVKFVFQRQSSTIELSTSGLDGNDTVAPAQATALIEDKVVNKVLSKYANTVDKEKYTLTGYQIDGTFKPLNTIVIDDFKATKLSHAIVAVFSKNNSSTTVTITGVDTKDIPTEQARIVKVGDNVSLTKPVLKSNTALPDKYTLSQVLWDNSPIESNLQNKRTTKKSHTLEFRYQKNNSTISYSSEGLVHGDTMTALPNQIAKIDDTVTLSEPTLASNIPLEKYILEKIIIDGQPKSDLSRENVHLTKLNHTVVYRYKQQNSNVTIAVNGLLPEDNIEDNIQTVLFGDEIILQNPGRNLASNKYQFVDAVIDNGTIVENNNEQIIFKTNKPTAKITINYEKKNSTISVDTNGLDMADRPLVKTVQSKVGETVTIPDLEPNTSNNQKYTLSRILVDGSQEDKYLTNKNLKVEKDSYSIIYEYTKNSSTINYTIEGLDTEHQIQNPSNTIASVEDTVVLTDPETLNINEIYYLKDIKVDGVATNTLKANRSFKTSKRNHTVTYVYEKKDTTINLSTSGLKPEDIPTPPTKTIQGKFGVNIGIDRLEPKTSLTMPEKYTLKNITLDTVNSEDLFQRNSFIPNREAHNIVFNYKQNDTSILVGTEGLEAKDIPAEQTISGKVGELVSIPRLEPTSKDTLPNKYTFVGLKLDTIRNDDALQGQNLQTTKRSHQLTYVYSRNKGTVTYQVEGLEQEDMPQIPEPSKADIESTLQIPQITPKTIYNNKYTLETIQLDGQNNEGLKTNREFELTKLNHTVTFIFKQNKSEITVTTEGLDSQDRPQDVVTQNKIGEGTIINSLKPTSLGDNPDKYELIEITLDSIQQELNNQGNTVNFIPSELNHRIVYKYNKHQGTVNIVEKDVFDETILHQSTSKALDGEITYTKDQSISDKYRIERVELDNRPYSGSGTDYKVPIISGKTQTLTVYYKRYSDITTSHDNINITPKSEVTANTEVTVAFKETQNLKPNKDYEVKIINKTTQEETSVGTINKKSPSTKFTMPNADVDVKLIGSTIRKTVKVEGANKNNLSTNLQQATEGETVTITYTLPTDESHTKYGCTPQYTIQTSDGRNIETIREVNSQKLNGQATADFTMPDEDTTVTATCTPNPIPRLTLKVNALDINQNPLPEGTVVKLRHKTENSVTEKIKELNGTEGQITFRDAEVGEYLVTVENNKINGTIQQKTNSINIPINTTETTNEFTATIEPEVIWNPLKLKVTKTEASSEVITDNELELSIRQASDDNRPISYNPENKKAKEGDFILLYLPSGSYNISATRLEEDRDNVTKVEGITVNKYGWLSTIDTRPENRESATDEHKQKVITIDRAPMKLAKVKLVFQAKTPDIANKSAQEELIKESQAGLVSTNILKPTPLLIDQTGNEPKITKIPFGEYKVAIANAKLNGTLQISPEYRIITISESDDNTTKIIPVDIIRNPLELKVKDSNTQQYFNEGLTLNIEEIPKQATKIYKHKQQGIGFSLEIDPSNYKAIVDYNRPGEPTRHTEKTFKVNYYGWIGTAIPNSKDQAIDENKIVEVEIAKPIMNTVEWTSQYIEVKENGSKITTGHKVEQGTQITIEAKPTKYNRVLSATIDGKVYKTFPANHTVTKDTVIQVKTENKGVILNITGKLTGSEIKIDGTKAVSGEVYEFGQTITVGLNEVDKAKYKDLALVSVKYDNKPIEISGNKATITIEGQEGNITLEVNTNFNPNWVIGKIQDIATHQGFKRMVLNLSNSSSEYLIKTPKGEKRVIANGKPLELDLPEGVTTIEQIKNGTGTRVHDPISIEVKKAKDGQHLDIVIKTAPEVNKNDEVIIERNEATNEITIRERPINNEGYQIKLPNPKTTEKETNPIKIEIIEKETGKKVLERTLNKTGDIINIPELTPNKDYIIKEIVEPGKKPVLEQMEISIGRNGEMTIKIPGQTPKQVPKPDKGKSVLDLSKDNTVLQKDQKRETPLRIQLQNPTNQELKLEIITNNNGVISKQTIKVPPHTNKFIVEIPAQKGKVTIKEVLQAGRHKVLQDMTIIIDDNNIPRVTYENGDEHLLDNEKEILIAPLVQYNPGSSGGNGGSGGSNSGNTNNNNDNDTITPDKSQNKEQEQSKNKTQIEKDKEAKAKQQAEQKAEQEKLDKAKEEAKKQQELTKQAEERAKAEQARLEQEQREREQREKIEKERRNNSSLSSDRTVNENTSSSKPVIPDKTIIAQSSEGIQNPNQIPNSELKRKDNKVASTNNLSSGTEEEIRGIYAINDIDTESNLPSTGVMELKTETVIGDGGTSGLNTENKVVTYKVKTATKGNMRQGRSYCRQDDLGYLEFLQIRDAQGNKINVSHIQCYEDSTLVHQDSDGNELYYIADEATPGALLPVQFTKEGLPDANKTSKLIQDSKKKLEQTGSSGYEIVKDTSNQGQTNPVVETIRYLPDWAKLIASIGTVVGLSLLAFLGASLYANNKKKKDWEEGNDKKKKPRR